MPLASATVDALADLGIPGVIGTIAGVLIGHITAKARSREEHQRTLELLVLQDERRAAQATLDGTREVKTLVPGWDVPAGSTGYQAVYRQWKDRVEPTAQLIRSEEFVKRKHATGFVLYLASVAREGEFVEDAVSRGLLDLETWLNHWLRNEKPPPAALPSSQEISELVNVAAEPARWSFDRLNERLPPLRW